MNLPQIIGNIIVVGLVFYMVGHVVFLLAKHTKRFWKPYWDMILYKYYIRQRLTEQEENNIRVIQAYFVEAEYKKIPEDKAVYNLLVNKWDERIIRLSQIDMELSEKERIKNERRRKKSRKKSAKDTTTTTNIATDTEGRSDEEIAGKERGVTSTVATTIPEATGRTTADSRGDSPAEGRGSDAVAGQRNIQAGTVEADGTKGFDIGKWYRGIIGRIKRPKQKH